MSLKNSKKTMVIFMSKIKIVGNFAYNKTPEVGDKIELRKINSRWENHVGCFVDGAQVGSVAHRVPKGYQNNDDIIDNIDKLSFCVIKKMMNIKGSYEFIAISMNSEDSVSFSKEEKWASKNWSRREAFEEFGQNVQEKQGYLGNESLVVILGGVGVNKFSQTPQFDWKDVKDGKRKWGYNSPNLFEAIMEAGANSGDKISICNKNRKWIIAKL